MAKESKRKYVPPEITRVVLRSEQAVLSACSVGATGSDGGGGTVCNNMVPPGCKRVFSPPGFGDPGAGS